MQRLYLAYLFFAALILLILSQETHYPDRGILAFLYILVFALSIHYGKLLTQQKALLAGIFWSAIILSLTGIMGWTRWIIHTDVQSLGMVGILGQKNLFANWIACGIVAGLSLRVNKYAIIYLMAILLLSGSRTTILYLPIIWLVWKKEQVQQWIR